MKRLRPPCANAAFYEAMQEVEQEVYGAVGSGRE